MTSVRRSRAIPAKHERAVFIGADQVVVGYGRAIGVQDDADPALRLADTRHRCLAHRHDINRRRRQLHHVAYGAPDHETGPSAAPRHGRNDIAAQPSARRCTTIDYLHAALLRRIGHFLCPRIELAGFRVVVLSAINCGNSLNVSPAMAIAAP